MKFFSKDKIAKLDLEVVKEKKHTLLLVDDEAANLRFLQGLLEKEYNIITASDGQEALELVINDPNPKRIDLILTDQRMPRMTGVEFLKESISTIPDTVRMILTGFTDIEAIIDAINQSKVYKYLTKPLEPEDLKITVKRALEAYELEKRNIKLVKELQELNESLEQKVEERTKELQVAYEKLEIMSLTDPLTSLNNRRYFQKLIPDLETACSQVESNLCFSFLLLDLDHFKSVNDIYGHDAGDYILTEAANVLKRVCSESEIIRWGGEEFLIILKNKSFIEAKEIAEDIRNSIDNHSFSYGTQGINQTVSIGLACLPFWKSFPSHLSWEQVLQLADQALYSSKKAGRNRWTALSPSVDKIDSPPKSADYIHSNNLREIEELIFEISD